MRNCARQKNCHARSRRFPSRVPSCCSCTGTGLVTMSVQGKILKEDKTSFCNAVSESGLLLAHESGRAMAAQCLGRPVAAPMGNGTTLVDPRGLCAQKRTFYQFISYDELYGSGGLLCYRGTLVRMCLRTHVPGYACACVRICLGTHVPGYACAWARKRNVLGTACCGRCRRVAAQCFRARVSPFRSRALRADARDPEHMWLLVLSRWERGR